MRSLSRTLPILIASALVISGVGYFAIQRLGSAQSQSFSETRQFVREPFLTYFEDKGGPNTLGYPLTPAYENDEGITVQTFERVQLQLTVRGIETAPIGPELNLSETAGTYEIASAFLDYYQLLGAEDFFGEPLNEARYEGDTLVQDFERARVITDNAGVRLGDLGSVYFTVYPPDLASGQANIRFPDSLSAYELNPTIGIAQPTVGIGDEQTIYLYVEDGNNQPVEGVQTIAVLLFGESRAEVQFNPTNDAGLTSATFVVPPATPGTQVLVKMHVLYKDTFLTVETTYTQWW